MARTTPQIRFFPDKAEGTAFRMKFEDPALNSTVDSFSRFHSRAYILNSIAYANARDSVPYVSTALVARDMRYMLEVFGSDKLQYWGFSYGTILGATYAAMFPDNIGRLVMDGVMDAEDYYTSSWTKSLLDTDKALQWFLQACVDAGPVQCALHEPATDKIRARLHRLFDKLKESPVPVFLPEHSFPGMRYGRITYSLTKSTLLIFLIAPYHDRGHFDARWISTALRDLERGNADMLWRTLGLLTERTLCDCYNPVGSSSLDFALTEAMAAIQCVDGDEVRDTVEDLKTYFETLAQHSEFADIEAIRGTCIGAKIRPVERFTGPFVANTSFPLLLIGNSADPATPLESAHKMSKGFSGSVVLTHNSTGHTSMSATSLCTARAIRAYFRDGTLPERGKLCDISSHMFGGQQAQKCEDLTAEDVAIMEAWESIRRRSVGIAPMGMPLLQIPIAG